ncbi:hypothetical protein H4219_000493 [Mycoemilia scoparia]|uniref:Ras GEF n=1 Tax=Mycoemilia scoparia TaxID=417184 RepID=A0A9W8DT27_9FUNG|nr:hypothetical protein H4219_000493 [Mycoemilia scoparia]
MSDSDYVCALHDFEGKDSLALSFKKGDYIKVLTRLDSGWWDGLLHNSRGWFPSNYVTGVNDEKVLKDIISKFGDAESSSASGSCESSARTKVSSLARVDYASTQAPPLKTAGLNSDASDGPLIYASSQNSYGPGTRKLADYGLTVVTENQEGMSLQAGELTLSTAVNASLPDTTVEPKEPIDLSDLKSEIHQTLQKTSGDIKEDLPSYWESRRTIDNKTYYCNLLTDETTWSIDRDSKLVVQSRGRSDTNASITPKEDRRTSQNSSSSSATVVTKETSTLVKAFLVRLQYQNNNNKASASGYHRRNSSRNIGSTSTVALGTPHSTSSSVLNLDFLGNFSDLSLELGKNDGTLTWDRLAASITLCAQQLQNAVQKELKHEYLPLTSKLIGAVRRLLLSSSGGGLERDAPVFRTHRLLRAHHRQITNSICAISLSAKIVSTVWPPPNSQRVVKEDAAALVRAVRQFMIEAENCGVTLQPPRLEEEMLEFLPGIVPNSTPANADSHMQNSNDSLVSQQVNTWSSRNQQSILPNSVPHSAIGESGWHDGLTVPSLFEADPEAQMRLRQQQAEYRSNAIKNQTTPTIGNVNPTNPAMSNGQASANTENNYQKMVDITSQIEDGARELARGMLLFQRFLARREVGQREGTESLGQRKNISSNSSKPPASPAANESGSSRMSHNSKLVAYSKLVISEMAQFLLVIDDLEHFEPIILSEREMSFPKENDDEKPSYASTLASHSEIAQINTLTALREARLEVSHDIGLLVAATQSFTQVAARISAHEINGQDTFSSKPSYYDMNIEEEYIQAITKVSSSLQAVDTSALTLWLSAKKVLEARDILELQSLWHRISQYHVPTNTLAPLPIGPKTMITPSDSVDASMSRRNSTDLSATYFRRSMSLPYLKHYSLMASPSISPQLRASNSVLRRNRAESSDQGLPPLPYLTVPPKTPNHLEPLPSVHPPGRSDPSVERRASVTSAPHSGNSENDIAPENVPSAKESRFGDKLKRFFFEDAASMLSSGSKRNGQNGKSAPRSSKRASVYSVYTATSGKSSNSFGGGGQVPEKSNRSSLIIDTPPSNMLTENSSYSSMSSVPAQPGLAAHPPLSPLSPGNLGTPAKTKQFFGEDAPGAPSISATSTLSRENSISSGGEKKLWFLQYDYSPQDLLLAVDGSVKGGTLPALIERLTAHDFYDTKYVQTFLLTYHSFCTTPEFFEELFQRFKIQPPAGLRPDELNIWTEKKLKPIRLRVYNILKQWLEQHYVEKVPGDPLALEMLQDFSFTFMADVMPKAAEQILQLIERRRASEGGFRKLVRNLPTSAPGPILPRSMKKLKLLDISPIELARQLTLIDSQLFNKIKTIECLKKAWSRSPNDPDAFNGLNCTIASNIQAMSVMSTQLTLWVSSVILQEADIKKRANVMRYFVTLADCCRQLNNFNSVMSILGSLLSTSIDRLSRTRQALNTRSMQVLQELRNLMCSDRNFHTYRTAVHSVNPPAIPFIGINRQDLTFIDDGNEDVLTTHRHLINFSKCIKTADTILELQGFQNVPYALTPVPEIQNWLMKQLEEFLPYADNPDPLFDKFFQVSRILEPKERDDEKFIRLLQESGFL